MGALVRCHCLSEVQGLNTAVMQVLGNAEGGLGWSQPMKASVSFIFVIMMGHVRLANSKIKRKARFHDVMWGL